MSAREFFWKHDVGVKILLLAIALLLLGNIVVLNRAVLTSAGETVKNTRGKLADQLSKPAPQPATHTCDEDCQRAIDERIAQLAATLSGTPRMRVTEAGSSREKPAQVYMPLGSGATTTKTDWVRVENSEASFALADYPRGAKVYWEGNIKTASSGSRCFVRLFDKTNSRAVDFSEQSTNKTENEYLTTQPLSIWAGKNKYQLEMKSLNGVTCSLDSPKLLIK